MRLVELITEAWTSC